ncbi:MAG: 2OG-Fe(II) oxygenase [Methylococcales bacterium]|nr:2OG-Fe(II) oxygenase [Methylococcales bacterium]
MIKKIHQLDLLTITNLIQGCVHIVSLDSPYTGEMLHSIKNNILHQMHISAYANAPQIKRVGMAYFESIADPEKRNFYYKNAEKWNREIRDACLPFHSPIDYMIFELDIAWPAGCKRAIFNGHKMFSGLTRIFPEGVAAEPHQDILRRDALEIFEKLKISEQIAFNLYVDVPENGGELELWNWVPTDEEFIKYQHHESNLAYGIDRSKIHNSSIIYKPKAGEMLFFNPKFVHAVRPALKGERIAIASFIGYVDGNTELMAWS